MTFEEWMEKNHPKIGKADPRYLAARAGWDAAEQNYQRRLSLAQARVTELEAQLKQAQDDIDFWKRGVDVVGSIAKGMAA